MAKCWMYRTGKARAVGPSSLLQKHRDTAAAKRFFRRLLDDHEVPEQLVTDGLRSYRAAIRQVSELSASEHITVSAAERQNNLIEQSQRPTREQERQQRGFRTVLRAQRFLFTHAEVSNLFRHTRSRTPAHLRRRNLVRSFGLWAELSLTIV